MHILTINLKQIEDTHIGNDVCFHNNYTKPTLPTMEDLPPWVLWNHWSGSIIPTPPTHFMYIYPALLQLFTPNVALGNCRSEAYYTVE